MIIGPSRVRFNSIRSIHLNELYFQTPFEGRIYTLKVHCGDRYPEEPPTIRFQSRINLTGVAANGSVRKFLSKFSSSTSFSVFRLIQNQFLLYVIGVEI